MEAFAHNLGHPSTATLLRLMRHAGANDAVQRYARWWKCPQCSEREAPEATPSTTAPFGRIAYGPIFGLEAISLCSYILPPGTKPIILDLVAGRIAYAPIFSLRAVSLCSYILPPGA